MSDPRMCVAIDVGTHGIGFAIAPVSPANDDPLARKIHHFNQWDSQPDPAAKNLSALLLDSDDQLIAWGYEARRLWLTQGRTLRQAGARYHHGFKMDLGASAHTTSMSVVASAALDDPATGDGELLDGPHRPPQAGRSHTDRRAADLLTILLRQVVDKALQQIKASGYDEDDIRWTITVPACWTDYQKAIVRDILKNAGLPAEDGRVLLSLEPEAAAHYARLTTAAPKGAKRNSGGALMQPGARFMVVDCGGGTVDITAYQNDDDGKMTEIGRSLGDRLGSDFLNRKLENDYLQECLGDADALAVIREQCPDALLNIIDQWERAKVGVTLDQEDSVELQIPAAIDRIMGPAVRKRLARRQNKVDDSIILTPVQLHALFDTVVPGTLDLIEAQLKEMDAARADGQGPDTILLVGGFGSSPYLQQAVKERFGDRATVLVPPNPDIAVLHGAVHFCYDPQTRARRSRFTYGVDFHTAFKEDVDPQAKRWVTPEGDVLCMDRFSIFVRAGESVSTNAEVVHEYIPLTNDVTYLSVPIYATRDPDPRYVSDAGCDRLAHIRVDLTPVMRFARQERGVRVYMKFGETEIKVRAELIQGGQPVAAQVRFHSNY
ncbi:Hsp70 family protein [Streptomyces sp. NPDC002209]|uniref:Hsp70 family protein n=1 Tax=Streptomyces sp. NPDC002209 TaxID=3364638 RepID=UPI003685F8EA